jgi:hypothetical protein
MPTGAGTATLNFGTHGTSNASVVVTGQTGITSDSLAESWVMASTTATNNADNHSLFAAIAGITVGSIVAGTGFTITAISIEPVSGSFLVEWVWSTPPV